MALKWSPGGVKIVQKWISGRLWGALGASWASWSGLGSIWGRSWSALGAFLAALGAVWGPLGPLLGRSWGWFWAPGELFWRLLSLFFIVPLPNAKTTKNADSIAFFEFF